MTMLIERVKSLTLIHAIIAAVVAALLASLVVKGGILNTILWIVAVGALAVGAINYLSYGR